MVFLLSPCAARFLNMRAELDGTSLGHKDELTVQVPLRGPIPHDREGVAAGVR